MVEFNQYIRTISYFEMESLLNTEQFNSLSKGVRKQNVSQSKNLYYNKILTVKKFFVLDFDIMENFVEFQINSSDGRLKNGFFIQKDSHKIPPTFIKLGWTEVSYK